MADEVVARPGQSKFQAHSNGTHLMQCVDVIDLGEKVVSFPDKPSYLAPTCAIVFASGERNGDNSLITVQKDYTVSTSERSNLRKALEAWRGKPWTDEEIEAGIPLGKLAGKNAIVTVNQKKTKKGRTFAEIMSIAPPMKGMQMTEDISDYKRADFWKERLEENRKAVAAFHAQLDRDPSDASDIPDNQPAVYGHDNDEAIPF